MGKIFEDIFSEIQIDMIKICFEYVYGSASKIYVHSSYEDNTISCSHFYEIEGRVLECHKIDTISSKYDVSIRRQKQCMDVLKENMKKLIALCHDDGKPIPTDIRIVYNVDTKSLESNCQYELMYSNHQTKTADDVALEWYESVKRATELGLQ